MYNECIICQRTLVGQKQQTTGRCPTHRDDTRKIRGLRWSKWSTIERETPATRTYTAVTVEDFLRAIEGYRADGDTEKVEHLQNFVRHVPLTERPTKAAIPQETGELKSAVNFAAAMLRKGEVFIVASQIAARYYRVDVNDVRRLLASRSGKQHNSSKR